MKKSGYIAVIFAALLVVSGLCLVPRDAAFAAPGEDKYTAVLKYYDDVQITYTVNYPNGGVWTGAGDIPIGGVTNGASSQLYCVDPFVHFHSVADTTWPGPDYITTDTMGNYTVAAPWSISSSLTKVRDAVEWLTINGYRGNYTANDATSRNSIARFKALYPTIMSGLDDSSIKRIALMATKISIWKELEGSNVVIQSTSLPAAQQTKLNALVTQMMSDAETGRSVSGVTSQKTTMSEDILTNVGGNAMVHEPPTLANGKGYYGPLQIKTEVDNFASGNFGSLDRVYLSANGPTDAGIKFVTFDNGAIPGNYDTLPDSPSILKDGDIYGTGAPGQYFSESDGSMSNGIWTSPIFYLEVPLGRTGPANSASADLLTIHSMAKTDDVTLMPGTPVTFVHTSGGGIQAWNSVQAYIGGANDGIKADLFANASISIGNTPLGVLTVSKNVVNTTADDGTREYYFAVYYSQNSGGPFTERVQLSTANVLGACTVNEANDVFDIRNGLTATIRDLPAGFYQVVEFEDVGANFASVEFQIDSGGGLSSKQTAAFSNNLYHADPVEIDPPAQSQYGANPAAVLFTNTKHKPNVRIYVSKLAMSITDEVRNYDSGHPYDFQLEHSTDGVNWSPLDLTGLNFGGDETQMVSASQGRFSVGTTGMAYIDMPPPQTGEIYRIAETNIDSNLTPVYSNLTVDDSGNVVGTDSGAGHQGISTLTTNAIPALLNQSHFVSFVNSRLYIGDLTISKTVSGAGITDSNRDELFPFQLVLTDDPVNKQRITVPLTTDPNAALPGTTGGALLISGVSADRLTDPDSSGFPTVFWLKHGETVTVRDMPYGPYELTEYPGNLTANTNYKINWTVRNSDGSGSPVSGANSRMAGFDMTGDDRTASFVNSLTTQPDTPVTPAPFTPDNPDIPDRPDVPDDNDNGGGDSDGGSDSGGSPGTGDSFDPALWTTIMICAGALIFSLLTFLIRERKRIFRGR